MNEKIFSKILAPTRFDRIGAFLTLLFEDEKIFSKNLKNFSFKPCVFSFWGNEGTKTPSMDFENRIHIRQDISSDVREHKPQRCSAP